MGTVSFSLKIAGLFLFPALVYGASVFRHGNLTLDYLSKWLVGNFLLLALPHYLVVAAFFIIPLRRKSLISMLMALNLLLAAFQGWVWLSAPPREAGLAWVYYYPLSALCIGTVCGVAHFKRKRGVGP